jgi:hypothetical protein
VNSGGTIEEVCLHGDDGAKQISGHALELVEDDVLEVAVDAHTAVSPPSFLNCLNIAFDCLHLCGRRDLLLLQGFWREVDLSKVLTIQRLDLKGRDLVDVSVETKNRDGGGHRKRERQRKREEVNTQKEQREGPRTETFFSSDISGAQERPSTSIEFSPHTKPSSRRRAMMVESQNESQSARLNKTNTCPAVFLEPFSF